MSWWDVVSGRLERGDSLFTPGRGIKGLNKKPFDIVSVTSDSLKILSGESFIRIERKCFDIIENEYKKNPFLSLRVATIREKEPLENSADKLLRENTSSKQWIGNYVCSILEHCGLVHYEMQGDIKVIVLSEKESI